MWKEIKAISILVTICLGFGIGAVLAIIFWTPADSLSADTIKTHISKKDTDQKVLQLRMIEYIQDRNIAVYPKMAETIVEAITQASQKYGLPPKILLALIEVESSFRYDVVSSAGAVGLMQVHRDTWFSSERESENLIELGILDKKSDLYDPAKNIMAGAYILHKYYSEAVKAKSPNPMLKALTRYYGGTKNYHYDKTCKSLGEFYMFSSLTN